AVDAGDAGAVSLLLARDVSHGARPAHQRHEGRRGRGVRLCAVGGRRRRAGDGLLGLPAADGRAARVRHHHAQGMSEWGPWPRIVVRHAAATFESQARIDREWQALNYAAAPEYAAAARQHDAFIELLAKGAHVHVIDAPADGLTLDAIYVRDASIVTPRGAILCRMGKPARRGEPEALAREYASLGVPVLGAIEPPGQVEGGDFTWLGARVAAVGRGYRT